MDDVKTLDITNFVTTRLSKECRLRLGHFTVSYHNDPGHAICYLLEAQNYSQNYCYQATTLEDLAKIVEMSYRDSLIANLTASVRVSNQLQILLNDYAQLIITQPASTNSHNNYVGGWHKHTHCVINVAEKLSNIFFDRNDDESRQSLLFCALVHDLGKLGSPEQPGYIYDPVKDTFVHNPYYDNKISHELRSINILNNYNVSLTSEEFAAIVYHGGLYNHSLNTFAKIEKGLPLLLHTADNLSAKLLEERE